MVKKEAAAYTSRSFNETEYLRRLRLMREIVSGENQTGFAARLGIPFKRWANFERGYPIPRQVAWMLWDQFGISVEWLWYGVDGNLKNSFLERLKLAEIADREHRAAEQQLARAKARLEKASKARKKVTRRKRTPVEHQNS